MIEDITTLLLQAISNKKKQEDDDDDNVVNNKNEKTRINDIFILNPSICYWKDDKYIVLFRSIEFSGYANDIQLHPWKIWDNGYKFLNEDPNRPFLWNRKSYKKPGFWFQKQWNADHFTPLYKQRPNYFPENQDLTQQQDPFEIDTTGAAIFLKKRNEPWKLLYCNQYLCGKSEMIQDARISKPNDEKPNHFHFTYNRFFGGHYVMAHREMMICEEQEEGGDSFHLYLYVTEESPLLPCTFEKKMEKNCLFLANENIILYGLDWNGLHFFRGKENKKISQKTEIMHKLREFFGEKDAQYISFSLGANPVRYQNQWLGTAHMKVEYKKCSTELLRFFLKDVRMNDIYKHGKLIYFLFLYECDDSFHIGRISKSFIPTSQSSSHLPYLQCFCTGLVCHDSRQEIILSYGEGDVRCKTITFSFSFVENLLSFSWEMQFWDHLFCFLNTDSILQQSIIIYCGYYRHWNCGDDAFWYVFRYLHHQFFSSCQYLFLETTQNVITFIEKNPRKKIERIIFGGGDIINDYFLSSSSSILESLPFPKYAIGVGVPYLSCRHLLRGFDHIVLRNNNKDIISVGERKTCTTFPDLAFFLPFLSYHEFGFISIQSSKTLFLKEHKHHCHCDDENHDNVCCCHHDDDNDVVDSSSSFYRWIFQQSNSKDTTSKSSCFLNWIRKSGQDRGKKGDHLLENQDNDTKNFINHHNSPSFFSRKAYSHNKIPKNNELHLGIIITRTFYQRHSLHYITFISNIARVLYCIVKEMQSRENVIVFLHLIPFCISPHQRQENDILILQHIYDLFLLFSDHYPHIHIFKPSFTLQYVQEIYHKLSEMDFIICSRFHAHIFSIIHCVPFISFSCSRKCKLFMEYYGLEDNYYELPTNYDERPAPFHVSHTLQFILSKIEKRKQIRLLLYEIYHERIIPEMLRFQEYFRSMALSLQSIK